MAPECQRGRREFVLLGGEKNPPKQTKTVILFMRRSEASPQFVFFSSSRLLSFWICFDPRCFHHKIPEVLCGYVFRGSFITSASSNHVLRLDSCQQSDSRPFGWSSCPDPWRWQEIGQRPVELHLTLNYPLCGKRGMLSLD